MRTQTAVILILAALAGVWFAEGEGKGDGADLYRRALLEAMPVQQARQLLERVARERADGPWADDALWVLGERARQGGDARRVVYYWNVLMGRGRAVHLDDLTRAQPLYRTSRAAQAALYLEATGKRYVADGERRRAAGAVLLNAQPVDVMAMTVWEGLGLAYLELSRPALALKAYGAALDHAPPESPWAAHYRTAIAHARETSARRARRREESPSGQVLAAGATAPPRRAPAAAELHGGQGAAGGKPAP